MKTMTDYKAVKIIRNGCEFEFPGSGGGADGITAIVVGGGGGGTCIDGQYGHSGGGGGEVIITSMSGASAQVCIGAGGGLGEPNKRGSRGGLAGCPTCMTYGTTTIIARGGCETSYSMGGTSGSGCGGGSDSNSSSRGWYMGGGGGGAAGNGTDAGFSSSHCTYWTGNGGAALFGYGGGGAGKDHNWNCGTMTPGYGAGGAGGECGCQGIVVFMYDCTKVTASGGDCCTTVGNMKFHCFTSDGTFTIVS